MTNIILADNQDIAQIALNHIIGKEDDLQLQAIAKNDVELFDFLNTETDLLIIDYDQGDAFQINTLKKVNEAFPNLPIMIVSADREDTSILQVVNLGVCCFVTKDCSLEEILDGIYATKRKEKFFCKKILDVVLEDEYGASNDCNPGNLSERELEIVRYTVEGNTAKQIADKLYLSHHTVNTHRKNIMKKLGIKSSSELAIFAINTGIIKS